MQEEDDLRTVECLRGRLLAERAASRAAKEKAAFMDNKLMELEKQLKIETKLRRKAEKKLSILKTKLNSLNITTTFGISEVSEEQSSVPDSSQTSCISSTASVGDNAEQTHNNHGLKTSMLEKKSNESDTKENSDDYHGDNSMALVPVNLSWPIDSKNSSHMDKRIDSETVREVLDTLKQVRENLQRTMVRRRMIEAGY